MVRDIDAKVNLFPETFKLIKDQEKLNELSRNILKLAKSDAAKEIVDVILNEIRHK